MSWNKIIFSGSDAILSSLQLDNPLGVIYGGLGLAAASASGVLVGVDSTTYALVGSNGTGQIVRSNGATGLNASGSFSGSFIGSGAGLTGVTADSQFSISGSLGGFTFQTATDALNFTTASGITHGFDLSSSFNGTDKFIHLVTPQDLRTTATPTFAGINGGLISGSTLLLDNLPDGATTDDVLIIDNDDFVNFRPIDSRVWGSSLLDGSGSATRVGFFSDVNTIVSNAAFTYDGTNLTVGNSTFGTDVVIAGNLTVQGTTTIINVDNLTVEDRFILLNSGSATGDGGFIVQSGSATAFNGVAFGWDDSAGRWGVQQDVLLTHSSSAMTTEGYFAVVVDVDGGQSDSLSYQKSGNLRISGSEAYIWIP